MVALPNGIQKDIIDKGHCERMGSNLKMIDFQASLPVMTCFQRNISKRLKTVNRDEGGLL
jgi:hypothetical protein